MPPARSSVLLVACSVALLLMSCTAAPQGYTLQLQTLNDSGVTGTATLTDLGDGTTRVVVDVDPAGHLAMPAHIHPGTCQELVPQPLYPLEVVESGHSETVVPASLQELLAGDQALNLHASADDMRTYTACVDLN